LAAITALGRFESGTVQHQHQPRRRKPGTFAEIAGQAGRDVHRRRSMDPHGFCQRVARLWHQIS
jgi:hypothetical protein